jgi:hypothetical protein
MPQLTPYVTARILSAALSPATYMACFDDQQLGVTDDVDVSLPVTLVLKRAHARVISRLPPIYATLPPASVPDNIPALLEDAELCYGEAYAYDRHPEYCKTYGEPKFKSGDAIMELIQIGLLRIADNPPAPQPANVGGIVINEGHSNFIGSTNGVLNSGDF